MRGFLVGGALAWLIGISWASPAPPPAIDDRGEPVRLEPVVVSAGRVEQKLREVPANVTVLTREEIQRSPAQTIDDLLRQIPGFSLFRRASSLVAQPTTQGVSLRGIGPSGVSRTLVLLDGVPFNDPFGGWVYWSKVPLESIERIEVVRGGGSGVYGNYALGGVINILTRRPEARLAQATLELGTRNTVEADLLASHVTGPWGGSAEGNIFRTDGYKIVRLDQRGAVDINADSSHETFNGRLEYAPSPASSLFLAGSLFHEDRGNGTRLQNNSTEAGYVATGGRLRAPDWGNWEFMLFSHLQTFDSTFSRIFNSRNSEALTVDQEVPSAALGGSLQWTKQLLPQHLVTAGVDARRIQGESDEALFNFAGTTIVTQRDSGGVQNLFGLFAQDIITLSPRLQVTAALRFDYWRNSNAFRTDTTVATGAVTSIAFPTKTATNVSPKLAALYRMNDELSLRASFYEGFRAPTLNELFRQFRVQNVVTLANPNLGPERLTGGEIGADYVLGNRWLAKLTGFWNELEDPISNVTIPNVLPDCPAGTTCRQRRNLGRTRSRGVEVELHYAPTTHWEFSASYLYNDSTVISFPADPSLVGKRIPQVPEHMYTLHARYLNPQIVNIAAQGRFVGSQFEDDLNSTELGSVFVVDLSVWRPIPIPKASAAELFLAVENLFDTTYAVGKDPSTGVVTTGTPLLVHGGIRIRF
jgi:outer membrane receptor protein involved in Fe transport